MKIKKETKTKGYYESLGMSRYTMILPKEHKEKLSDIAAQFRITQGAVIEALLDNIDMDRMSPILAAKETKGGGRPSQAVKQRDLINMLKGMTLEEMEAAQRSINLIKTAPKI